MSKLTFVPLTDQTSRAQGKQAVVQDGVRVGFVFRREGEKPWSAYVAGRPELIARGPSREKALAGARRLVGQGEDAS